MSSGRPVPASSLQLKSKKRAPSVASSPAAQAGSDLRELDALFAKAGLVRHRRKKKADTDHRAQSKPLTPEELRPAAAQTTVAENGVEYVAVPGWSKIPWLWHGFSTRRGGVSSVYAAEGAAGELNLGFTTEDTRENVLRNRELLAEAITGDAATPVVTVRQIHSSVVVQAGSESGSPCKGDGLISDHPGFLIGVQTADCIPVLVADRKRKVVAAFHAGWRGTVKRIVENGIGRMRLEYGCNPENMVAAIGPGIGPCCYAVGEEVISEFDSQFTYGKELFREVFDSDPVRTKYPMLFLTQRAPGHAPTGPSIHLDLFEANRRQLLAAGLKPRAIQTVGGCTSCQTDLFFSYRSSKGSSGRMLSAIGIRGR